jgi:hypothetical protein
MITDLDELGALLDARRRMLFRLETLDVYEVASDGSDYRRYLDGEPEPEWERRGAARDGDATLCCRPRCRLDSRYPVRAMVGGSAAVPSLRRIGGVSPSTAPWTDETFSVSRPSRRPLAT